MLSRTRSAVIAATVLSLLPLSSALPKAQGTASGQGGYLAACIASTSSDETNICNPDSVAAIQYCIVSTAPPESVAAEIGGLVTYCAEQREPAKNSASITGRVPTGQGIQWSNASAPTTTPSSTQWADWSSTVSSTATPSPSSQWADWSNTTTTSSTSEWVDWSTESPSPAATSQAEETWSDWSIPASSAPPAPETTSSSWEDWSSTTPTPAATTEAPSSTWEDWSSMPTLPSVPSSSSTKTWTFGATPSVSVGISSSTPHAPMASTFMGAANKLGSPASMLFVAVVAVLPLL
ncbi:hypothetical protein AYL99_00873 [Fonsecaea erecta]|uniref:Extracellular membrane protein CFEM domain-containing protein n=1 Tax=Fonsecaea erecta TaxID=1367422 RepID=A0A178ZZY0_9EURO|nr:hypothetical protein AYL99_00873 [Fonsecaea erecta]OAP64901.1 hypothetical protein AYL99_00873 [Fonsecaea erecta]